MGFAIVTFVLCLGAILGVYWALILRPETRRPARSPAASASSIGRRRARAPA